MKTFKITINNKEIFLFLLMFPFILPAQDALQTLLGDNIGLTIERLLKGWLWASFLIICALYLYALIRGRIKISGLVLLMLLIVITLFLSTVLQGESLNSIRFVLPQLLALFLLANLFGGDDFILLLKTLYFYLTFIMVINSITIFQSYPVGLASDITGTNFNYYLYGLDNVSFIYSFQGLVLGDVIRYLDHKKTRLTSYLPYIFIMASYFYVQAGTAMVIMIVYIIIRLLSKRIISIINYTATLVIMGISFIMIVIVNSLSIFSFILDLIGRNSTFTGRTIIWSTALSIWSRQHWLLGIGTSAQEMENLLVNYNQGQEWLEAIGHMHNIFLEFLIKGGLISGILFILIFLFLWKRMSTNNEYFLTKMLCVQLLLSWITCMFEFRLETITFWIVPIIMYNINDLVKINDTRYNLFAVKIKLKV